MKKWNRPVQKPLTKPLITATPQAFSHCGLGGVGLEVFVFVYEIYRRPCGLRCGLFCSFCYYYCVSFYFKVYFVVFAEWECGVSGYFGGYVKEESVIGFFAGFCSSVDECSCSRSHFLDLYLGTYFFLTRLFPVHNICT